MTVRVGRFRDWFASDTLDQAIDITEASFEVIEALNQDEMKQLVPLITQGDCLLEILNSPLAELASSTLPFVKVATGLLKFYIKATGKEPTLAQQVALVSQAAYLESFKTNLLAVPNAQTWIAKMGNKPASHLVKQQFKKLDAVELDAKEARRALIHFHTSPLASCFNQALSLRMQELGVKSEAANQFADRVARDTHRFMDQALEDVGENVQSLRQWFRGKSREAFEKYLSLEEYLEEQIRPQPHALIFDEQNITFRDLYVPLKVKPLDRTGKPGSQAIDLEIWISDHLQDAQPQILFIQGEAGRGKSVFCRMFADRVRRELHPSFTPILIRLRRLTTLEHTLSATLASYETLQTSDFVASDAGWLTDKNTRFLFFLDGFDELLLEDRASGGLKEFLQQVEAFQQGSHHRFIVTGRPLTLQGIDRLISQMEYLQQAEIQPMDDELQQAWLERWQAKVGEAEAQAFWKFLQACPRDVQQNLAREPLLLYLLARMHREQQLQMQLFATSQDKHAKGTLAKIRIYDAAVNWVLEKQRQNENLRLTRLDHEDVRQVLMEAALCVVQSGNEFAKMTMLEVRLKDSNNPIAALLQQARQSTAIAEDRVLNNLLTTFYLKPASGDKGGAVEFAHKSFGEFLFADRLKEAIEDWTRSGMKRDPFYLNDAQMDRQVYDLLGYGALTGEVVDYLMGLLSESAVFQPMALFQRLHRFYENWCDGEYLDQPPARNLPQAKMLQLQGMDIAIGLRQVDIYTGLNVMILLLELHRYAQSREELKGSIEFCPCCKEYPDEPFNPQLLCIIGYVKSLQDVEFVDLVGDFLSGAMLNHALLRRINFYHANLSEASLNNTDLTGANLSRSDLTSADLQDTFLVNAELNSTCLRHANLQRANLRRANLTSANLTGANLSDVDLSSANLNNAKLHAADLSGANLINADLWEANLAGAILTGAFLYGAILSHVDFSKANLKGILWDQHTQWEGAKGLENALNLPSKLKQQLGI